MHCVQYTWFNDMVFKIEWNLDEAEELAQESLLGDIRLRDKEHFIEERSVYLDSWFYALIKAAKDFVYTKNEEVRIEIPEESLPLVIHFEPNGRVATSFRGRSVSAESQSEFISELLEASGSFLEKIRVVKDIDQNASVNLIRDHRELLHSRR